MQRFLRWVKVISIPTLLGIIGGAATGLYTTGKQNGVDEQKFLQLQAQVVELDKNGGAAVDELVKKQIQVNSEVKTDLGWIKSKLTDIDTIKDKLDSIDSKLDKKVKR